jgi:hypothetical protein
MICAYYDESGEYDASGAIVNMTIGGCVSSQEKWEAFNGAWRKLLGDEGLDYFHMCEFEAWQPPFDFKLANGERDKERHKRILNTALDLMFAYIEGFYGYGAVSGDLPEGRGKHDRLMEDCIGGAIKDVVLRVWRNYEEPIHLVFGKQPHLSEELISRYVKFYDYGEAAHRTGSLTHRNTFEVPALQAADVLAYELARVQRKDRPERYPWRRLIGGAKSNQIPFSIMWGPISSARANLSGHGAAWQTS